MYIFLSLLICLVGAFAFVASKTNPDMKEIGRMMFWCGLLAFLLTVHGNRVLAFLN